MIKKKTQSPVISLMIMILGAMVGYFLSSFFSAPEEDLLTDIVVTDPQAAGFANGLSFKYENFGEMKFDFQALDKKEYKDLMIYGPEIIKPESGRGDKIFE